MKKIILFTLPLMLMCSAQAGNPDMLNNFSERFPNIIMGEVYYVSQTSFFISVDLEFKGTLSSPTFEVVFDGTNVKPADVKLGEKTLVFIDRWLISPLENIPYVSFKVSKFDRFHGQCAYRFMNSELDSDFLSQLTSVLYKKEVAALYNY
jgi:hypothetical protein